MDRHAVMLVAGLAVVSMLVMSAAAQDPDRCCLPDQFTISKSATSGSLPRGRLRRFGQIVTLEEHEQAYDFTNDRAAARITSTFINGLPTKYTKLVEDMKTGNSWLIECDSDWEAIKCSSVPSIRFPFHLERCISNYTFYSGEVYIGDKAILADSWAIFIPDEKQYPTSGLISWTVGRDNCVPLADSFAGKTDVWNLKQHLVMSSVYWDYTLGIDNPDYYFTVPDICYEEEEKENGKPRKHSDGGAHSGDSNAERPRKN